VADSDNIYDAIFISLMTSILIGLNRRAFVTILPEIEKPISKNRAIHFY